MSFKICTKCEQKWENREEFLSDTNIDLVGYQVNFGDLAEGFFLFNHIAEECGTSLAIEARDFTDMHNGPIFEARLENSETCPDYCKEPTSLKTCHEKCECSYVRDVLEKVKEWPKKK